MFKYLKKLKCKGIMIGSLFPFSTVNEFDKVEIGDNDSKEKPPSEGWKRLKKMFQTDEFGNVSDEVTVVSQTAMMSSFIGLVYGGVMHSRTAYTDFMRQNTAASFTSHFEAKRKLQDAVTKSFGKGAFKWCWRTTLFSTSFMGISTMVSVYRGKNGICEYVIGGAATGSLYKWQMGPRGWLVGGAVGGFLGLFCGTFSYGMLKLSGYTMQDIKKNQAHIGGYRKDLLRKGMKRKEEQDDPILKGVKESDEAVNEEP